MFEKLKNRYVIMMICISLITAVILYQLLEIQIVKGEYYDDLSQRKILSSREIAAPRGKILDRNGVTIASSRIGFIVQIVKTKTDNDRFNDVLLNLIKLFEKNNVSYYKTLSKYLAISPYGFGSYINQSQNRINTWIKEIALSSSDAKNLKTPQEVFNYLREKKYKISSRYTDEEAYKIMTLRYELTTKGYTSINPVVVAEDANWATVAVLEESSVDYPGITTDSQSFRSYYDASFIGNVLGYVGGINEDEYKNLKDKGYNLNDIIGKDGIEKQAETYLKGKDGKKTIAIDMGGRQTEELSKDPAVPGNNVQLTIDMNLQKIATESLKRNIDLIRNRNGGTNVRGNLGDAYAGSVVAIDVNNGEILAMASYPSYDPNIFLASKDNKDAQKAISALYKSDSGNPTFNRAIAGRYAPGSTFKPLVGVAAIENGVVTPDYTVNDTGTLKIDGMNFYCLEYRNGLGSHGVINLRRALATSCNIYFHQVGRLTGINVIDQWAKTFGLGEKTGIDLPGEYKGIRSNPEFKKTLTKYSWGNADTAQTSIGQLYNAYTPIELVNYISTLANGGKKFTPHIIKEVTKPDGSVLMKTPNDFTQINLKPETLSAVREGMVAVTNSSDGTAVSVFKDFPFKVAGKTGTAETGDTSHSNNGVFVSYAPADNPRIAIAVVIERGVFGYFAAPIAKDIMTEYFKFNNPSVSDAATTDGINFTR